MVRNSANSMLIEILFRASAGQTLRPDPRFQLLYFVDINTLYRINITNYASASIEASQNQNISSPKDWCYLPVTGNSLTIFKRSNSTQTAYQWRLDKEASSLESSPTIVSSHANIMNNLITDTFKIFTRPPSSATPIPCLGDMLYPSNELSLPFVLADANIGGIQYFWGIGIRESGVGNFDSNTAICVIPESDVKDNIYFQRQTSLPLFTSLNNEVLLDSSTIPISVMPDEIVSISIDVKPSTPRTAWKSLLYKIASEEDPNISLNGSYVTVRGPSCGPSWNSWTPVNLTVRVNDQFGGFWKVSYQVIKNEIRSCPRDTSLPTKSLIPTTARTSDSKITRASSSIMMIASPATTSARASDSTYTRVASSTSFLTSAATTTVSLSTTTKIERSIALTVSLAVTSARAPDLTTSSPTALLAMAATTTISLSTSVGEDLPLISTAAEGSRKITYRPILVLNAPDTTSTADTNLSIVDNTNLLIAIGSGIAIVALITVSGVFFYLSSKTKLQSLPQHGSTVLMMPLSQAHLFRSRNDNLRDSRSRSIALLAQGSHQNVHDRKFGNSSSSLLLEAGVIDPRLHLNPYNNAAHLRVIAPLPPIQSQMTIRAAAARSETKLSTMAPQKEYDDNTMDDSTSILQQLPFDMRSQDITQLTKISVATTLVATDTGVIVFPLFLDISIKEAVNIHDKIHSGSAVKVYSAIPKKGSQLFGLSKVAVRRYKYSCGDSVDVMEGLKAQFQREVRDNFPSAPMFGKLISLVQVSIMYALRGCENIVTLYATCVKDLAIISKFFKSNLKEFVVKNSSNFSSCKSVALTLRLALDLMNAVKALHEIDVAHNDIKSTNCLIERAVKTAKRPHGFKLILADFSLACGYNDERLKVVSGRKDVETKGLSLRYAAPEALLAYFNSALKPDGVGYTKIDIYGAVSTTYEMFTGRSPWDKLTTFEEISEAVASGERPDFNSMMQDNRGVRAMINIVTLGWSQNPKERPSAKSLYDMLNSVDLDAPIDSHR